MEEKIAGYTSFGIGKIAALGSFLPEYTRAIRLGPFSRHPDAVIGWGLKPTSLKARRMAQRHSLPYVALEDGFVRSLGLAAQGYQPHSLVVDHSGIYYDASRPSDLENLLNTHTFSEEERARARHCMALLKRERLSKYNHAPDTPTADAQSADVLVVDQTAGDASIEYGGATAQSFEAMLTHALEAHPTSTLWVKIHPDVIAGSKQGHLTRALGHPRCKVISEDINPWALFDRVDTVYVVTSQLGFEALLAGKTVHCFGLPFYAGWGLTRDQLACPRRTVKRRLEEVFAAAYLHYCRYVNPYTGEPSTLEATIALIGDQRRQQERLRGSWRACGFSHWKRGFVGDFLGPATRVDFQKTLPNDNTPETSHLLVWSSRIDEPFKQRHRALMPAIWRMEDGFIRSVGLGVDLARPLSLVIDRQGIYYDPSQPSDLETLLNESDFSQTELTRAAHLKKRLVALKLSKYNVQGKAAFELPAGAFTVLVPGQVESDASIATGSPRVSTNSALLKAVRRACPDAFILYKAHPDVLSGARVGKLDKEAATLYDLDASDLEISTLLERVDAVHTMSSLAGFEALLRGCQVTTYGLPFYAGWGLTTDTMRCKRRTRRLSLDALVAGTLIRYPSYVDPRTRQLCNAETVVTLLEQARTRSPALRLRQRLYRYYRNVWIGSH
ncbi:capsular polysaccharide biosynthesis protein [Halomonas sp. HNIBRBA4712]|uniref:capsular polysaccharide biosynthesis protein n=1 Tax=Halomonas sp. HNIBRBA4712 TaxID=3373087 RepID=UPI00374547E3